ncbi:NAD(P)H-dependent oxidoreductase [Rhizobium sp. P40RR-XXII]|uniref:NAD(P)H-dependent oxidoreductase n=1 Tax=Rhizobium sp. P40RR-XXII TaxID=2726739 RepID=UPI0014569661|nr:NAD(P)H-dependent oxidoreductase [Rhizobium sp. P40RR-XXII]NLS20411.1 NAD(P)H-dependent oxidoreductase [Rhizobium sp. P40RR-XXII]
MSRHILIIEAHPNGHDKHLCGALADSYAAGAAEAGFMLRRLDISQLDFPLLRSREAFENGTLPQSLVPAGEALQWAEHIVFVFPLWLGTMPALLKAFLEQLFRPGLAFQYQDGGAKELLGGCTARIIVTMGMPATVYRFWFGAHGINVLRRSILNFAGIRPVRQTYFGMVEQAGKRRRERWLAQVEMLGRRGS